MSFMDGLRERMAGALGVRLASVHDVGGIRVRVHNSRPDIATPDVLERLGEAISLIETYAPSRYRHLRRDIAGIRVERFPCRGAYFPADRSCLTELTFLARRDIPASVVASSILHEGVHARVDRFRARVGGRRDGADLAREERLCRAAEVAFGRALPPALGAPVLERALGTLTLDDGGVAPGIDWAVAQARQDAADAEGFPDSDVR